MTRSSTYVVWALDESRLEPRDRHTYVLYDPVRDRVCVGGWEQVRAYVDSDGGHADAIGRLEAVYLCRGPTNIKK
jgi:hypothetical protein